MDFLNQAFGQIKDLLDSMTPAARVTATLLLAVIVVSMGYLVQHNSAGPDEYLFNGEILPGSDVDRAEAAIAKANLTNYQRVGNRIKIPSGQRALYLAAVANDGALPPTYHTVIEKALDLGPFTDRVTRQERLKAASEQRLSMIVRAMDGIEEAQVIYDVREPEGLSRVGKATASVNVKPNPGEILDARRRKMIKKAVASAIAELSMDNVSVTNLGDGSTFSSDDITSDFFDDEYYQHRVAYEQLMKSKIEDLLHKISGVRVQVTAELDDTVEKTTRTVTPEGEAATISQTTESGDKETSELTNGGQPGPFAQGPNRQGNQDAPEVTLKNKDTKTVEQAEYLNGQKDEFLRSAALVPKHVRVAIAVPESHVTELWRERERRLGNDPTGTFPDNTASAPIKKNIEDQVSGLVAPLLPKELAENPFSKVSVQFVDSVRPKELPSPTMGEQAMFWANQNFNTMTMAVVAIVSLLMLRSLVKSIPKPDTAAALAGSVLGVNPAATAEGGSNSDSQEEEVETGPDGRPKLRLRKGTDLKEDLSEIVREDPETAAAILRSWIGNAG